MAKYVFNSNIFMNLQRRQPIDIYPSLWNKLGELMTSGIIISSQEYMMKSQLVEMNLKNGQNHAKSIFCHQMLLSKVRSELFFKVIEV